MATTKRTVEVALSTNGLDAQGRPQRTPLVTDESGAVMTLEVHAKAAGGGFSALPPEMWAALPYLATLLVLVLISLRRTGSSGAPACLGKPFIPTA